MKTLKELDEDNQYQTDKLGRCPINTHDYTEAYQFHLSRYRGQVFNFWEIGIDRGDSLRMWRDYFPNATIVGIDIVPSNLSLERVVTVHGDATDPKLIETLLKNYPPTIVLDGGNHTARDMNKALELIGQHTELYVVEDVGTQYRSIYGEMYLNDVAFTDKCHETCDVLAMNQSQSQWSRVVWERRQVYFYRSNNALG